MNIQIPGNIHILLDSLVYNYNTIQEGGFGGVDQVTFYGDKMVTSDGTFIIDWLLENGGEFSDNKDNYEPMGDPDTYHLWLGIPAVKICCGFVYHGKAENCVLVYGLEKRAALPKVPNAPV